MEDSKHFADDMIETGANFEKERDKAQQENANLKEKLKEYEEV